MNDFKEHLNILKGKILKQLDIKQETSGRTGFDLPYIEDGSGYYAELYGSEWYVISKVKKVGDDWLVIMENNDELFFEDLPVETQCEIIDYIRTL